MDGAVDDIAGQYGLAAAILPAGRHARDEYQNRAALTSRSGAFQIRITIDTDRGVVYVYSGMKRFPVLLLGVLLATGCAPRVYYRWSSLQGRDCFWSCQNIINTCSARCVGSSLALNLICSGQCTNMGKQCAATCPDLVATTTP